MDTAESRSDTPTPLRLNAALMNAGQQYSSYEPRRASARTRGTLMLNSCGGAYWHA